MGTASKSAVPASVGGGLPGRCGAPAQHGLHASRQFAGLDGLVTRSCAGIEPGDPDDLRLARHDQNDRRNAVARRALTRLVVDDQGAR
jgi:hypothetical protein